MADTYTRVTTESWFGRIGNSIKGVLFGGVLVLGSFFLLFWNEGRAVKTYKTLKEGQGLVVSVASAKVDQAHEGKLIHTTGRAETRQNLADPVFQLGANALRLRRSVEMYQWKESKKESTREKIGGGTETVTTYTYNKEWSDDLIDSRKFDTPTGHQNPDAMVYKEEEWIAEPVTMGGFRLSPSLVRKVTPFVPLTLDAAATVPVELQGKFKLTSTGFYYGADPAVPQIGDLRISHQVVRATDVSVIARQVSDSFEPFAAKAGGTIELLQTGVRTAEEMFAKAHKDNEMLTWILRLVGFVLMLIGWSLIFKPLSVLASVLPFLGSLVGLGTGFLAFMLSCALSLTTIALAWIFYRPILGLALLFVALVLIALLRRKSKKASV